MTPSKNLSLYYPSSSTKTFEYPYASFLSNEREIAYTIIIQSANLLFPLENNIHWGVKYPAADDHTDSKLENLDKTVDRILEVARSCAQKKGNMEIRISKLEKLPLKEYQKKETMLSTYRGLKGKKPLDDWIMENKDELGFASCYEFIYEELASKRRYFGLESVKARSGSGCCSICRKEMIQGVQVIRMPCSHTFHGICIFQWLARKPTCPLCRSVLMDRSTTVQLIID
ncbi:hypothetical protein ACJIZ3_020334 [Penstemon smallii]|uniref:RING-type domain-containing protein n=1 Tax=Penstemon smallii TaxID=265156 RepID=A0ABD3SIX0_9LAMI